MMVTVLRSFHLICLILLFFSTGSLAQTDDSGYPVLEKGSAAVNISGTDTSGKLIPLFSLKNKYILLFFYETSCHLCEAILPEMKEHYRAWKEQGCEIYAIPLNRNYEEWKLLMLNNQFPWINVIDTTNADGVRSAYKITVTPTVYVLDSERKIASSRLARPEKIDEWLLHHSKSNSEKDE